MDETNLLKPCIATFEQLAVEDPTELERWLDDATISDGMRAHAAVAVGMMKDSDYAKKLLLPLLNHKAHIVQEGAIYGLEKHIDDEVIKALKQVMNSPKTGIMIRYAIEDVLTERVCLSIEIRRM